MLVIRILLNVIPEHRNQFTMLMEEDTKSTKAYAGCEHFAIYQHVNDENHFILYEEWASKEQFYVYRDSEAFKERSSRIFPLLNGEPQLAYYEAVAMEQN